MPALRGPEPGKPQSRGGASSHQIRPWSLLVWVLVAAAIAYWVTGNFGLGEEERPVISYSDFREQLQAGNVANVTLKGNVIRGEMKEPVQRPNAEEAQEYTQFTTYVPAFGDTQLLDLLESQKVEIRTEPEGGSSWWPILLISALPFVALVLLGLFFFRQMQQRGRSIMSVGKSGAKLYERRDESTTFDDVAGAKGAKGELVEIIEFLKEPSRFQSLGGRVPKGVLLVGPPGTGKTLLARAVAGEANVPFFSITGSDFMEMFVGVGASRVRDLFKQAKQVSPAIIFIDELDSIGRHRGAGLGGGHDEREQTLNQLLSELDGFEPSESVIVMAATNRPDILDPALLRPGRFDRRVMVELPSAEERSEILRLHARDKPLTKDVDLDAVARGTPGFSGADLSNLLNEAALIGARKEHDAIHPEDIEEARDKILMGLKRQGLALTDEELELLAYHEAGHAIVAEALPGTDPIHKVTIIPRGRAMGVTQQLPEQDKYIYERDYMLDRLTVMLGGRAAEDLVFDTATSGAENDLKQATDLARRMVLDWGMSEQLGPMAAGGQRQEVFLGEEIAQRPKYSETTAREVDEEVKRILDDCFLRAEQTLRQNRAALDRLAELLREREEIPGDEVSEIFNAEKES
ncbi:MAG: ATP-dependent zinc metalloprotease FtsH [Gemmatimonadales bacterium]